MKRDKLPSAALLTALAMCLGQCVFYYKRLPWLAVSHFNAAGLPNGYMHKGFLVSLYAGAALLTAAMFLFGAVVTSKVPDANINLPNKEHWLAPERRAETLRWISGHLQWFAAATLLLLFDVFGQMFRVNIGAEAGLTHPVASIAVYFAFSALWIAALWRRFSL